MILTNDVSPARGLYALGGSVMATMHMSRKSNYSFDELLSDLRSSDVAIPAAYLLLTLDWLFLAGAITFDDDRRLSLCF